MCQNRHDIVAEELTFAAEEGGDHLVDRNPDADDGKYDNFYQYEVRTNWDQKHIFTAASLKVCSQTGNLRNLTFSIRITIINHLFKF